jgi:hypothetical protein
MSNDLSEARCPYCSSALSKIPQRKSKCPHCGQPIHVKASPTNREKRLVTELQAVEIEAQWSEYHEHQKWNSLLQTFGLTDNDFAREQSRLSPHPHVAREAARSLLVGIAASEASSHTRKRANHSLALLVDEAGEDFRPFLREAARCSLEHYRSVGVRRVEILAGEPGNTCSSCSRQHGRTFDIEEALTSTPLPCSRCTQTLYSENRGFCRCEYIPVV